MITEDEVLRKLAYTSIKTMMLSVTEEIITQNESTVLQLFQW